MTFSGPVKAIFLWLTLFSWFSLAMQSDNWNTIKSLRQNAKVPEGLFLSIVYNINRGWDDELQSILMENRDNSLLSQVLNSFTTEGLAPLHLALIASNKKIPILLLLLNNGAEPNTKILKDYARHNAGRKIQLFKGWSAAHIAMRYCKKSTMKFLWENGVDFFVPDDNGKLPNYYVSNGNMEAKSFFKECLEQPKERQTTADNFELLLSDDEQSTIMYIDYMTASALFCFTVYVLACGF